MESQLEELIARDDVRGFFSLVQGLLVELQGHKDSHGKRELATSKLLKLICDHNAINCATLLVLEKAIGPVDLNDPFDNGMLPLHHAAAALSSQFTVLFLHYGAETFLKCSSVGHVHHGLLPLEVALQSLSRHVKWTPGESIFKLVILLSLLKGSEPFIAVDVLAWNTAEVKQVFLRCAKEGKLIELGTLLTVANEKVIPRGKRTRRKNDCTSEMEDNNWEGDCFVHGNMTLREYIASEIAFLINQEIKLILEDCHMLVQMDSQKKMELMSVMLLLEIFQRAGVDIYRLRCPPFSQLSFRSWNDGAREIASTLEKAGFALTDQDRFLKPEDCFSAELLKKLSERAEQEVVLQPFYSGAPRLIGEKQESNLRFQEQMLQASLRSVAVEKQKFSFAMRPFYALRTFSSYAPKFPTTVEAQVERSYKLPMHSVTKFLASKQLSFVLAISKGMRRM